MNKLPALSELGPVRLVSHAEQMGMGFEDVVVLLASDEHFAPYMAVALQSIVEHVSPERHYDIVVLTRNMSQQTIDTLVGHTRHPNVKLGFLDAETALKGTHLPCHGHFRPETFFRLLAPWLLPQVRKAIYLDSDLVVLEDLSELFDISVEGYLLAATRDADMLGQMGGYDSTVGPYLSQELGLRDPSLYFQAGVVMLNLEAFRHVFSVTDMLSLSTRKLWRWLDQDILNMLADGKYVTLDMRWNTLMDWKRLRRANIIAQAPDDIREQYEQARMQPAIVHFAGPDDRPWDYPECDMAAYFWEYAQRSAFIAELERRLRLSRGSLGGRANRAKVDLIFKGVMPLFDHLCPPGSERRTRVIKGYVALGGDIT